MYPEAPYEDISWPITQHSGVLSKDSLDGLLHACLLCRGERVDPDKINRYLVENKILTENVRSDSNKADAWRDYQQILSEFGLMYSTLIDKVIKLTPVAMAYLNGNLTYGELITLQILRYQYPNGHKSTLSSSLKESLGDGLTFETLTELQADCNILIRPAVLVWQALNLLWEKGQTAVLSEGEMQRYMVRCARNSDLNYCVDAIINSRENGVELQPMIRAKRNMSDWMKILGQTLLFRLSDDKNNLALSKYSICNRKQVERICSMLSNPDSFWILTGKDFKTDWFDYYGNYDENIQFIIKE